MIKDSINNVIIKELNYNKNPSNPFGIKRIIKNDFSSLCRYQNSQGNVVLYSVAQNSCNGTNEPLITYQGTEISGVVGLSSNMMSNRIKSATRYLVFISIYGSIIL